MPKPLTYLLVSSTESYSGKSATVLGLGYQLQNRGLEIAYGKPLGTFPSQQDDEIDEDVRFIAKSLDLPTGRLCPTVLTLDETTIADRLTGQDQTDYQQALVNYGHEQAGDLILLEGPGTLDEGKLFDLSLPQVAEYMDALILIVARFHSVLIVDSLLATKQRLGKHLAGVLINDVPPEQLDSVQTTVKPYLEKQGIPVFGVLPRNQLLRSVSVGELVERLDAEILCSPERMDLLVESLSIGAMNVNSALKYFRKGQNMAVVTGGDRTDIQLAALETSTQCLILTGHLPPSAEILARAEDLEVPILSVDLDTLTTVEIIDQTFGQVRLHEPIKVQCMKELMESHFDIDRLMASLGIQPAISA